jgi:hypothetical protein
MVFSILKDAKRRNFVHPRTNGLLPYGKHSLRWKNAKVKRGIGLLLKKKGPAGSQATTLCFVGKSKTHNAKLGQILNPAKKISEIFSSLFNCLKMGQIIFGKTARKWPLEAMRLFFGQPGLSRTAIFPKGDEQGVAAFSCSGELEQPQAPGLTAHRLMLIFPESLPDQILSNHSQNYAVLHTDIRIHTERFFPGW